MIFQRFKQSLCYIITICVLLFGMCSANVGTHSSFALKNTAPTRPVTVFSDSAIRMPQNASPTQQAYTREAIMQYEVILAPQQTLRRVCNRMGQRTVLTFISIILCAIFTPALSTAIIRHFYDEITINEVVISYIHRQDGEKRIFSLS